MRKSIYIICILLLTKWVAMAQIGCPEGYENGSNVILNPNFNQGMTGFYSDYKKNQTKEWFAASIYVTDNPTSVHNNYRLCLDSNFKNQGPLLVVDGSQDRNSIVWQQKVNILAHTDYYFSLFFATLLKPNPSQLEISINDKRLPKPFDYHYQHCKGSIYFNFWNSEQSTEADIKIKTVTTDLMGNDFVLDNIQLFKCTKKEPLVLVKKDPDSISYTFLIKGKNDELLKRGKAIIKSSNDSLAIKHQIDSTGSIKLKIPNNKYIITLQVKDYFKLTDTLNKIENDSVLLKTYLLSPLDSGVVFTLKNLVFERSSADITNESKAELENIIELLTDNPSISLEINGHTDNQGDAVKNYELSLQRVTNVKFYLIEKGMNAERLNGTGFGGTKPLVGYGTDEERKMNRRVEFVIVKKK